mgnify:CR=1 FL=1
MPANFASCEQEVMPALAQRGTPQGLRLCAAAWTAEPGRAFLEIEIVRGYSFIAILMPVGFL